MLSRLIANPAVRFFAIFILIVEAAAFAGFSFFGSELYTDESAFQRGARDLTTDWINGTEAVRLEQPGVSTLPICGLMLAAAMFAGFHAIRGRATRQQESGS